MPEIHKYPADVAQRTPGPIMMRRARDVISSPDTWRLGSGLLIWRNQHGEGVTDQLVEAVRQGRLDA